MGGWLIYHPKRERSCLGDTVVYHDSFAGNQDPYVWNRRFLHTCCHMTQISPKTGDINFWVSGESLREFAHLWCDLVFVVEDKVCWQETNRIDPDDPMVESAKAYVDHYEPCCRQHPYKRQGMRRFTLKADSEQSFQPQTESRQLIDALPIVLAETRLSLPTLRSMMRAGFNSKPLKLEDATGQRLYQYLYDHAPIRLRGDELEHVRE